MAWRCSGAVCTGQEVDRSFPGSFCCSPCIATNYVSCLALIHPRCKCNPYLLVHLRTKSVVDIHFSGVIAPQLSRASSCYCSFSLQYRIPGTSLCGCWSRVRRISRCVRFRRSASGARQFLRMLPTVKAIRWECTFSLAYRLSFQYADVVLSMYDCLIAHHIADTAQYCCGVYADTAVETVTVL